MAFVLSQEEKQSPPDFAAASQKKELSAQKVSELAAKNRADISHFKDVTARIRLEKKRRNELNSKTKEMREKRRAVIDKIIHLRDKLGLVLAGLKESSDSPSIESLQNQIESLEWTQQTEDLSAKKEKEFSKKIRELEKLLPKAEHAKDSRAEIAALRKQIGEESAAIEALDKNLKPALAQANAHHERVLALYKEAGQLSKTITYNFAQLDMARLEADTSFGEYSKTKEKILREEKAQKEALRKELESQKRTEKEKITDKARKIFEAFKGGKKISTDEFRILQESGLL